MPSDNPWFVSFTSPPPGLPPVIETNGRITCSDPCIDSQAVLENLENQNDILASPQLSLSFPSVGSALHGTGMCKPCCWFWKPEGCKHKKECLHCHLCSKVEASQRKINRKAMRMGLMPVCGSYMGLAHCQN